MSPDPATHRFSPHWLRRFGFFTIMALILTLGSMAHVASASDTIQPELRAVATRSPNERLHAIVQKLGPDSHAEAHVVQLGGVIIKDLSIINAFVAELAAQDAIRLTATDGVRWVSLDGLVVKTGGPDGAVTTAALLNTYNKTVGADKVWAEGYQGSGIGVAVVDSGVFHQLGALVRS